MSAVLPMKLISRIPLPLMLQKNPWADVKGIEKYWDLDESKRTEAELKSVHHLMVSAVMDMSGVLTVILKTRSLSI